MYIPVAILIGLFQAMDSLALYKSGGSPNRFNYFMSTVEFMWVFISVVFLFTGENAGAEQLSPIVYISYVVTTFIVGTMMMKGLHDLEKPSDIKVPVVFTRLGIGFGLLYALLNVLLLLGVL